MFYSVIVVQLIMTLAMGYTRQIKISFNEVIMNTLQG